MLLSLIEVTGFLLLSPFIAVAVADMVGVNFAGTIDPIELLIVKSIEVPVLVLLIAGLQRLRGDSLRDLGLRIGRLGARADVKLGLIFTPVMIVLSISLGALLQALGLESEQPHQIQDALGFVALLAVGILAGGVAEEIQYRGYVFQRFEAVSLGLQPKAKRAAAIRAALLTSLAFSVMHAYQGAASVGVILVLALALQALYLTAGRRLLPVMICHGLFNSFQIVVLWLST